MRSSETSIGSNYFEGQSSPIPLPGKKREVKIIKRIPGQPPLLDNKAADEAALKAIANDRWPKKGNLSLPDHLELRTAEKIFPRIDKIIDPTLGLPVKATMPRKKRPAEYTPSELEIAALKHSAHGSPEKTKEKAKKEFKKLFDPMETDSPS